MSSPRGLGFTWMKEVREGGRLGRSGKYATVPIKSETHSPAAGGGEQGE